MRGIPHTTLALAELRTIAQERRQIIAKGTAPSGAAIRLANLERAAQIVMLAGRITYFEAPDPTEEEAKLLGIVIEKPENP